MAKNRPIPVSNCGYCNGDGYTMNPVTDKNGKTVEVRVTCVDCKGTGKVAGSGRS